MLEASRAFIFWYVLKTRFFLAPCCVVPRLLWCLVLAMSKSWCFKGQSSELGENKQLRGHRRCRDVAASILVGIPKRRWFKVELQDSPTVQNERIWVHLRYFSGWCVQVHIGSWVMVLHQILGWSCWIDMCWRLITSDSADTVKPDGTNLFQVCAGGFVHSWSAVPRVEESLLEDVKPSGLPLVAVLSSHVVDFIGARRLAWWFRTCALDKRTGPSTMQ